MGKLSSGCDILFVVNGNKENAIWMGSELSSGLTSYQAIAEELKKLPGVRMNLRDLLKLEINTRVLTDEDLSTEGIVHNSTVRNLANRYTDLNWDNVDLSTKLIMADRFMYYGNDLSNCIIRTGGQKIIVINPDIEELVKNLNSYLVVQSKLTLYSDETKAIIDSSNISRILEQLDKIIEPLGKSVREFEKLSSEVSEALEKEESVSSYKMRKLVKLSLDKLKYEAFKKILPKTAKELIYDFLENSSKYYGLSYTIGNSALSIVTEIENVCRLLEGKKIREAIYNDVFANEIYANADYVPSKGTSRVSKSDFIGALLNKVEDLRLKRESLEEGSTEYQESIDLTKRINNFLELTSKTDDKWKRIIDVLIDSSDDEFSYSLSEIDRNNIYLKNVPKILEERYSDFNHKTVEVLKPSGPSHKGYTVYVSPDGKDFYYSRHILTTKSYGKKRASREECIEAIEKSVLSDPISKLTLIEFKTRGDRDVVWVPNLFIPGQVIKSLDVLFDKNLVLNSTEEGLLFNNGLNNSNNLNTFYKYVVGIVDYKSPDYIKKNLMKIVDTAEKAACFIYMLNEKEGFDRLKISTETLDEILDRIAGLKYEYFVVESVGKLSHAGEKYGYRAYVNTRYDSNLGKVVQDRKGTYQTLLTKINSAEINNSLVQTNEGVGRLVPSVRLLTDLAQKMKDKLGITVHIENLSSLEELFKEWGHKMPDNVHGFVKNGEIYINSSNATDGDVFHEFTHLILGVLKAKNYDNYVDLVNLVANHNSSKYLKLSMRNTYKYLAEQDLNEEVFAEMFSRYISGRDLGAFMNGTLKNARKAVDKEMGSIFGADRITDAFYNAKLGNIFNLFSHDLGEIVKEGNGLEVSLGNTFRQATTWIESQILKYKDSKNGDIGIYEDCD